MRLKVVWLCYSSLPTVNLTTQEAMPSKKRKMAQPDSNPRLAALGFHPSHPDYSSILEALRFAPLQPDSNPTLVTPGFAPGFTPSQPDSIPTLVTPGFTPSKPDYNPMNYLPSSFLIVLVLLLMFRTCFRQRFRSYLRVLASSCVVGQYLRDLVW